MGLPPGAYYVTTTAWSLKHLDGEVCRVMTIGRVSIVGYAGRGAQMVYATNTHDTEDAALAEAVKETERAEVRGFVLYTMPRDAAADDMAEHDLAQHGHYYGTSMELDDMYGHIQRNGGFLEPGSRIKDEPDTRSREDW